MGRVCVKSYPVKDDGTDDFEIPQGALSYLIEGRRIKFYPEVYDGRRPTKAIPYHAAKIRVKSDCRSKTIYRDVMFL